MGVELKNELDSVSYALGINLGNNIKSNGMDSVNAEALAAGIRAVFGEEDAKLSEAESGQVLNEYFTKLQQAQAEKSMKAGQDFLAENGKQEGVVTTESGLQYKVIKAGSGKTPGLNDQVTTHYHGTFIDGSVFDSSKERGTPATFGVTQVIKGWTEALQLMKEGDVWMLYIPFDLAYGERGNQGIPGYSTLLFEIELIKVN